MLVLASSSPYRRAQLGQLGHAFEWQAPEVDEEAVKARISDPVTLAQTLAEQKARTILEQKPEATVIAGDQVVDFQGEVLGKPGSKEAAVAQLMRMSGQTHTLVTALCVAKGSDYLLHVDCTSLTLRPLEKAQIERYVVQDNPIDCAGAYKFERAGITLFERVQTEDPSAITGLPLIAVVRLLDTLGYTVP